MELTLPVLLSGAGTAIGILVFVLSFRGRPISESRSADVGRVTRALVPSVVIGFLVLLLTHWPAAAVLAALAVAATPSVLGKTSSSVKTGRIEAIAVWTELLRDTLGAAAGLGEAIMATAPLSPSAIRPQVSRLADRLAGGVPMSVGLRSFADELDDPSGDMVACTLLISAAARTQKLGEVLSALAESIREEVAMRLRVETSRVAARSSVRTIVVFSVLFIVALMVLARSYLMPLGTPVGQVVLVGVGLCYACGIVLMLRLVRPVREQRILAAHRQAHDYYDGVTEP